LPSFLAKVSGLKVLTNEIRLLYDANLLLANCLNSECYVSREVREEIEATMLLPMAEIEKWKEERKRKKEEN
jgi:hypothetical protein